jgi:hypothetical protein
MKAGHCRSANDALRALSPREISVGRPQFLGDHSIGNNASIDYEKAKAVATAPFTGDDIEQRFKDLESKRYFLITNSDFVKYRSMHKKGGDFVVYSDIGYETITPVTFEFKK